LIIGSGLAGLNAALEAAKHGSVVLVTKSTLHSSSSYWAQGGIAAVLNHPDTFESHSKDTIEAGREFGNLQAVEVLIREGAQAVQELIKLGMPFDKERGEFSLGLEGGHSARRIYRAGGAATGKMMIDFLISHVRNNPKITVMENTFVFDLVSENGLCTGANVYYHFEHTFDKISSSATILATGGYSGLFGRSTNPHTSTGDGLWLSNSIGCTLKDLEFIQFHPTAFYNSSGEVFLISEALRGEGAILRNSKGERFMEKFTQKELAPRDVVAREIFREIRKQDTNFVTLDLRHLDNNKFKKQFPNLINRIKKSGLNPEKDLIPVAPAAHYCIGGIETDIDGFTGIEGLYACGEVAATGVHGANRLASNSLLECLVFSKRAVIHASAKSNLRIKSSSSSDNKFLKIDESGSEVFIKIRNQIASLMNIHAGIERNEKGLKFALAELNEMQKLLEDKTQIEYYTLRTKGILMIANRIVKASILREKSLGVHYRSDSVSLYDEKLDSIRFQDEIVQKY